MPYLYKRIYIINFLTILNYYIIIHCDCLLIIPLICCVRGPLVLYLFFQTCHGSGRKMMMKIVL